MWEFFGEGLTYFVKIVEGVADFVKMSMGIFYGRGYQFCKKWVRGFFGEGVTYFVKIVEGVTNFVKKMGIKWYQLFSPTFRKKVL